ncbi:DNA-directed DNA polymerase I [Candidatus Bathyarchaeota archaeon]|nr:DNA-directed DNA polymerase I [Candidatus Bathyarchaeota archaeon]
MDTMCARKKRSGDDLDENQHSLFDFSRDAKGKKRATKTSPQEQEENAKSDGKKTSSDANAGAARAPSSASAGKPGKPLKKVSKEPGKSGRVDTKHGTSHEQPEGIGHSGQSKQRGMTGSIEKSTRSKEGSKTNIVHAHSKEVSIDLDDLIACDSKVFKGSSENSRITPPAIIAPASFEHFLLLNVEYDRDTNKALMRFYDVENQQVHFLLDPTNHEPYCFSRLSIDKLEDKGVRTVDGFVRMERVTKKDLIANQDVTLTRIVGKTPLSIASGRKSVRSKVPDALEANIRYHLNYIADLQLVPGLYYSFKDGKVELDDIELDGETRSEIDRVMQDAPGEYKEFFIQYLQLFSPPIPDISRAAIDLEIYQEHENQFPDPSNARYPIIAASIVGTDGLNEVYVLGTHEFKAIGPSDHPFPENARIIVYDKEKDLVRKLFRMMWKYPIVVTYNGDEFDFRYLSRRAKNKKFADKDEIPISMTRGIGISRHSAFLKYGLHLDLYQFFRNPSIQGYALGGAYNEFSLDAVAQGLLGTQKFQHEGGISELSFMDLAFYNWKDSYLTLELTRFKSNLVLSLVILLMRICRLPMNEIVRTWVSGWVKQLLIWEHRKRDFLVPNRDDISQSGGDRELKGAIVINPKPGIYFDVVVMDFASLYPSIIKEYNLSYETVNCQCDGCEKIPLSNTPYHACGDRIGIMSLVTGVIRDLRVLFFKPKAKDPSIPEATRDFYDTLQSALKVLINASYGVYGSPTFSLYCLPVAEATTAIGRYSITQTMDKAEKLGVEVLYGDSDSVFLKNPGEEIIKQLSKWSQEHLHLELDVDKAYRFLALSNRKKNYLGVFKGGGVDIKGLSGKKSNTPQFIQDAFFKLTELIESIKDETDFQAKRETIISLVKYYWTKLKKGDLPVEAYAVKIGLNSKTARKINAKREPDLKLQHVMAARQLIALGKKSKFEAGDVFTYVKTHGGAKAIGIAHVQEVDRKKYKELFRSTFEQVLDALGISFEDIIGIKKLDQFF